jgi:hypothetical protein
MRCPRKSRKVSKTRCFNDNDVVVHRTPGRCPRGSRKTSKTRCFDDNDNEIIFTPSASPLYAPNSQNSYVPGSHSPPYVPSPYAPGSQSPPYVPVRPGNLALQANPPKPSIHTIPPYMLNHIQRFMGPETTRGYMRPNNFAMLTQAPSIGRMMFDFLYQGGDERIKQRYTRYKEELRQGQPSLTIRATVFESFKEYVRQTYIANKVKPIPLTLQEEQHYKTKFNTVFSLFFEGIPNRENVLRYLEDTTTVRFRNPYNKMKYHKRGF